jgi:ADP-ribose pyrophosphatase YjhB (NUDIX family)
MDYPTSSEVVQAAGGLVIRRIGDVLQIAVIHRPVQEDWSYPKGKLEEGETFEAAALREVHEETGLHCRLIRFLGHTEYIDRKGRPKAVAYWVMAAEDGSFRPNEEVDEVRWLTPADAAGLLSYERDRELLAVVVASDQVERIL